MSILRFGLFRPFQLPFLGVLGLCLFLVACQTSPQKKADASTAGGGGIDWLYNTPTKYPSSAWIVGRGQGRSLETAKDRARADIAKQFKVNISAASVSRTEVSAQISANGTDEKVEQNTSDTVDASTDLVLGGIEVVEGVEDKSSGDSNTRYAALAVLNKGRLAAALEGQIAALDDDARASLKTGEDPNANILGRIGALQNVLTTQQQKQDLAALLVVLRPSTEFAPVTPLEGVRLQIRQLKGQITAMLEVQGDAFAERPSRAALAKAGIREVKDGQYKIVISLSLPEAVATNGNQFLRTGSLGVTVSGGSGEVAQGCRFMLRRVAGSKQFVDLLIEKSINTLLADFFDNVFSGKSIKECV